MPSYTLKYKLSYFQHFYLFMLKWINSNNKYIHYILSKIKKQTIYKNLIISNLDFSFNLLLILFYE